MVSRFAWETIGRVGAWMISSHVSTAHSHHSPGKEGLDRMGVFETRSDSLCVDWMVVNLSGYGECSQVVASGNSIIVGGVSVWIWVVCGRGWWIVWDARLIGAR